MDKTDGFIPGMEDSEEAAKSFLDSFLYVQSPADEISDSDLQARDTANMIKHGELYTQLLDIYVSDIKVTLKYSLQGTTQGNGLTGGVPPVRFSM